MGIHRHMGKLAGLALMAALAACGGGQNGASSGLFGGGALPAAETKSAAQVAQEQNDIALGVDRSSPANRTTLRDLFRHGDNPNTLIKVNKYIWEASLDVLNFLPVESVDPFTGVIVTGYGRPPGGGRAYRATIYVQDPALDARSLKLAMQTQGGGAVAPETVRAVEDAILSRARELRIADGKL